MSGSGNGSRALAARVAGALARSALLRNGRRLWAANEGEWTLPLSRLEKVQAGLYLVLRDSETGLFPPTRATRDEAIASEVAYSASLPGVDLPAVREMHMRKPFWTGGSRELLGAFVELVEALERLGIVPPARLLELGSGPGWMAEFLALQRYDVVGTTLSEEDVRDARRRCASIEAKGLTPTLDFVAAPMEDVDRVLAAAPPFDAVYVFEALHHAFDWREAIRASRSLLKEGGWLLICKEPNRIHTLSAYRAATLSHTQEIGFSRRELVAQLRRTGFDQVRVLKHRVHLGVRPHWIAARRSG